MRIAYHPNAQNLTPFALNAWLNDTLAAWPNVTSGALISVKDPSWPFRFEKDTESNDRITTGGRKYAKVRYTATNAQLEFNNINEANVALWRAFYAATNGFRLPFIVEHPITRARFLMVGGGAFPFNLNIVRLYSGTVIWNERL